MPTLISKGCNYRNMDCITSYDFCQEFNWEWKIVQCVGEKGVTSWNIICLPLLLDAYEMYKTAAKSWKAHTCSLYDVLLQNNAYIPQVLGVCQTFPILLCTILKNKV